MAARKALERSDASHRSPQKCERTAASATRKAVERSDASHRSLQKCERTTALAARKALERSDASHRSPQKCERTTALATRRALDIRDARGTRSIDRFGNMSVRQPWLLGERWRGRALPTDYLTPAIGEANPDIRNTRNRKKSKKCIKNRRPPKFRILKFY